MVIGLQAYVDGATGMNNPVECVLDEAQMLWPDALSRIQSLVSIGTGKPESKDFGANLKDIVLTLKSIATDTENTHLRFAKCSIDRGLQGRYFRFNVDRGMANVRLDDHEKIGSIEAATQAYIKSPDVKYNAELFTGVLPADTGFVLKKQKDKFLKWLPYADQLQYRNHASLSRTEGCNTGGWFINGSFFKAWEESPNSLLWLYGKHDLERRHSDIVAFYYFSFNRREFQDIRSFKSSILLQIVKACMRPHPERKDHISIPAPYQNLRNAYYPSQHPSMADLDQTLREVIRQSSNTYLVIDALDECESGRVQGQLLKFLNTLAMDVPNLHILFTSRPEFNIRAAFDGLEATKFRVPFDDSAVDSDIHEHLGMLMSQQPYTRWSQALQSKVVSELSQNADGVFRWADLHVQQLQGKLREIDVERALKRLPGDLAGTYQRILEKIEFDIYGQEATALLRWLSRSRRPLTLLEVAEIAAFEVRNGEDIQLSPEAGDYEVIFSPRNRFDDFTEVLVPRDIFLHCGKKKHTQVSAAGRNESHQVMSLRQTYCSFTELTYDHRHSSLASKRRALWDRLLQYPHIELNPTNYSMQTPLLIAALEADELMFMFLIDRNDTDKSHLDCHGWGLLTAAIKGKNDNIVKYTMAQVSIDLRKEDSYGWTPLDWIVYCGHSLSILPVMNVPAPDTAMSKRFVSFELISEILFGGEVWKIGFSNDGKYLAVCMSTGEVTIVDVESMGEVWTRIAHPGGGATNVTWSPKDSMIFTSGRDNFGRVWDARVSGLFRMLVNYIKDQFTNRLIDREHHLVHVTA
ncbi:hypothetical protein MGN70_013277 [Eutypa lata]|nr:hypothetical protein MGN70_013277 [Eutypa lata]